jgi:hypothetical protein
MSEDMPGWYYVGNAQLRYMDADGWTEQYKSVNGAVESGVGPTPPSPDVIGPVTRASVRGQTTLNQSSFIRLSMAAATRLIALVTPLIAGVWRLITEGYRDGSASLSKRSMARQLPDARQFGVATAPPKRNIACAGCAAPVVDTARFCQACGAAVTQRSMADTSPQQQAYSSGILARARHGRSKYLVAGGLLLLTMIVLVNAGVFGTKSQPVTPEQKRQADGESLMRSWGCEAPRFGTGIGCLDADLAQNQNFGAELYTREEWASFQSPYKDTSPSAFVADFCRSYNSTADGWTHVILGPAGAWQFITSSDRLAARAIQDGGVDLRDETGRLQVC